jgi:hypothetical protein
VVAFQILGSSSLKSLAGVVLLAVGGAGAHEPDAAVTRYSHRMVQAVACRDNRDGGSHDGHEDDGHDRGRDHGGHEGDGHGDNGGPSTGTGMLQQVISVRVPAATFIRLDKSGRIIAAATNTRCQPSKQDEVFLLRAGGTIEPTTSIHVEDCKWIGDFTVPGRFQPQDCRLDHPGNKTTSS